MLCGFCRLCRADGKGPVLAIGFSKVLREGLGHDAEGDGVDDVAHPLGYAP